MENTKEEIDLIYILRSVKNSFSNFFTWVLNTTLKKFLIVILFAGIGASIGFLMFTVKKPMYVSDLTINHTRFDNDQCFELINNLTKLNGKEKQLSKVLKMDEKMLLEVKSISYEPLNARVTKIFNDSTKVMLPFKVYVEVYDPSVLDSLQNSLMNYLESNEYGVKRKQLQEDYLTKYSAKIKNEILAVDTLKRLVNQSIIHKNMGNGVVIDEPIDPVRISQRTIELCNAELKIEELKELNSSFELMVGFNGGVLKTANLMLSLFYGFVFGYILCLIWIYRRELKTK